MPTNQLILALDTVNRTCVS